MAVDLRRDPADGFGREHLDVRVGQPRAPAERDACLHQVEERGSAQHGSAQCPQSLAT